MRRRASAADKERLCCCRDDMSVPVSDRNATEPIAASHFLRDREVPETDCVVAQQGVALGEAAAGEEGVGGCHPRQKSAPSVQTGQSLPQTTRSQPKAPIVCSTKGRSVSAVQRSASA